VALFGGHDYSFHPRAFGFASYFFFRSVARSISTAEALDSFEMPCEITAMFLPLKKKLAAQALEDMALESYRDFVSSQHTALPLPERLRYGRDGRTTLPISSGGNEHRLKPMLPVHPRIRIKACQIPALP
jgi:hypothetical protein